LEVRVQERTHALALSNAQLTLEVTEHKRTELLLIAAKEWAENSARVKDQFMANMSHEIRTPMNGVLGLTGLLLETSLTADQRRYLSMVQSSAESLLSVINQVLDFSKLESGKAQLDIARFSLGHCIETLIDDLQIQAVQKGLMLQYRIAAGIPRFLLGDTGRLRQVLTNLIANAIKFTRKGRVDLEITRAPVVDGAEGQSDCRLQFAIHDTGIGIPASALESIFQPFVQADGSMTREFEGTGLGLAISKDLVTMMKGQISVASVEGSGSTFSFSAAFGIALEEAAPANPRQGPLRVLVAVDNLVDRIVVTGVLEGCGHHVTTAANGREVLDAHRASAFDVILMDVQIPLLDGFETTRALRETEALHGSARVPVIGLSAQGAEKDRSQCTEAGMSGYLSKPVHGRELISLIEELIGRVDRKKAGVGENAGQG
jgi:signal transduction histidine kinase/CheY-like chemotaxis protein